MAQHKPTDLCQEQTQEMYWKITKQISPGAKVIKLYSVLKFHRAHTQRRSPNFLSTIYRTQTSKNFQILNMLKSVPSAVLRQKKMAAHVEIGRFRCLSTELRMSTEYGFITLAPEPGFSLLKKHTCKRSVSIII